MHPNYIFRNLNDFFMKKLLLLFTLLASVILFGQATTLNQPTQYNSTCDYNNDGYATFSMLEISAEILGQDMSSYVVTHHLNQSDASSGINPLPNTYTNVVMGTQLIFERVLNITTNQVQIISYRLIVYSTPVVSTFTVSICDSDGTVNGITTSSPLSVYSSNFSNNNEYTVSYFHSLFQANANVNPIVATTAYTNINPNQEIIFVRVQSSTGCFSISQLLVLVQTCGASACESPSGLTISNNTYASAELSWTTSTSAANQYEVYMIIPGTSEQSMELQGTIATSSPFIISNLFCGTNYSAYIRTICGNSGNSTWSGPIVFSTLPCDPLIGQPTSLTECQNNGQACFDLTVNTPIILGNLNAASYSVSYFAFQSDATNNTNPITSPSQYCIATTSQLIFVRALNTVTNQVQNTSFYLMVNPTPEISTFTVSICDSDGTVNGITTSSPLSVYSSNFSNNDEYTVSYFHSQANAQANVNPIVATTPYTNTTPYQQVIFVRVQSSAGCFSISQIILLVQTCGTTSCVSPLGLSVSNNTSSSAVLNWTASSSANQYEIYVTPPGTSVPIATTQGIIATSSPFVISNLLCGTNYNAYIRTVCGNSGNSAWAGPISFSTLPCGPAIGQPTNLTQCQNNGQACFDLTVNTPIILGNLNPTSNSVSYFTSQADATNNANPITSPSQYCITTASQVIFARVSNATDATFQTVGFSIVANAYTSTVAVLADMTQCDDNSDSVVTFNLTTVQAQLNTTFALEYYTSLINAQYQTVPITNPAVFSVGTQSPSTTIFVREINPTSCDSIYKFNAIAYAVCNNAYVCNTANSLCSALGVPFANTHQNIQAETGNSYGCLNTRPNPTWFYLPVSSAGTINLMIQQSTDISFLNTAGNLDVDYICYGPFSNPVTPCSGQLTADKIVSCSYSISATEYPTILNALPGQYYLIMTTNFSNRAGYIKISEMSTTQGAINCSGLRLNAFLDANANGTQEVGEQNFPLGQFNYEVNQNGNVHNVIAPRGFYNIYDINPSNSYNISYTIDSNYTANYTVAPASYSNVNVVVGAGMQVYNFPVTVTNNYADLAIINVPTQQPRPGFTYINKVIYTNLGTQTVASGTVTFNKDALVTITANTQTGTVPTPTGFTYNFTNLLPFEVRTMTVTMQVPTIPTVTLGNLLTNSVTITPLTNDVVPANNAASVSQIIIGSYDPNDKMEAHGERILRSSFSANDYLDYTIRFENTGTASAIDVRVNDVLDSRLDENSIKMESASHNYVMDRIGNNINWRFDNIELPATSMNPIASNGYIQFKIKPKPGYAVGDIIPNTASIYFDFNPAIITNTFHTEFVAQLAVNEFENGNFVFYPNPTSDFVTISLKNTSNSIANIAVYDVVGKLILTLKPNESITTETIDLTSVHPGIYFVEVQTNTNLKVVKKLLVK